MEDIVDIINTNVKSFTLERTIKAFIQFVAIVVVVYVIPRKNVQLPELFTIAATGTAVMLILDTFAPSISSGFKTSLGWLIGFDLVNNVPPYRLPM
jgi:hypothetical protein